MFKFLNRIFTKAAPPLPASDSYNQWDFSNTTLGPTQEQLIAHYRGLVYTCAGINATAVASNPLRLYVKTASYQAEPKCRTAPISPRMSKALKERRGIAKAVEIVEVLEHPWLNLIDSVNTTLDGFGLMELTQLFQEIEGNAYWFIDRDNFGIPSAIWILPSQMVERVLDAKTGVLVGYNYRPTGVATAIFYKPEQIIHFKFPSLTDPYGLGVSPARAAWNDIVLLDNFNKYQTVAINNRSVPATIASPIEPITPEAATRIGNQLRAEMRRLNGGIMVSPRGLKIDSLSVPDGVAVNENQVITQENIANTFGVPLPFLTTNSNLANLTAARQQHTSMTVMPRCKRMAQKISQQLMPIYDPRLFVEFDDPTIEDELVDAQIAKILVDSGILSVNEVRAEMGYEAADGNDAPTRTPTASPQMQQMPPQAPQIGVNDDTRE